MTDAAAGNVKKPLDLGFLSLPRAEQDALIAIQEASLAASRDPYCRACDHDRHTCPGCGANLNHGFTVCIKCRNQR